MNNQHSFIFGGNTGTSYEAMKRKRAMAARLAATASRAPRNVGEGLSVLGHAIGSRRMMKQAGRAEEAGRAKFDSAFGRLLGGQAANHTVERKPGGMDAEQAVVDPVYRGAVPTGDMASYVQKGLVQRGLPEHVADGFVMNFKDESNLNSGINEASPIVPGSRGGFGLAQWTGPRRRQLEAFASQRGVEVSDPDMQMDFLMQELQGSEAGAARQILSTKDRGTAADAIVRSFLRPAEEHRERRSARYLGGAQPSYGEGQPGGGVSLELAQLAASPWASPEQKSVLGMLLQQQIASSAPLSPMQQMQMQQAQLGIQQSQLELERMRNPQADPMQQIELERAQLELEQMRNPQPETTDDIREYQFAQQNGFTGSFSEFVQGNKRAGSSSVTVNNATGQPNVPAYNELPAGYVYKRDDQGQIIIDENGVPTAAPIQGGPAAIEAAKIEETKGVAQANRERSGDVVIEDIDRTIGMMDDGGLPTTGVMGLLLSSVPGTDAHNTGKLLDTIKANVGFDRLQQMREASPTGGALGAVSQTEMHLLNSALGSLEQSQSQDQFRHNLTRLRQIYSDIVHGPEAANAAPVSDENLLEKYGLK